MKCPRDGGRCEWIGRDGFTNYNAQRDVVRVRLVVADVGTAASGGCEIGRDRLASDGRCRKDVFVLRSR